MHFINKLVLKCKSILNLYDPFHHYHDHLVVLIVRDGSRLKRRFKSWFATLPLTSHAFHGVRLCLSNERNIEIKRVSSDHGICKESEILVYLNKKSIDAI